MESALVLWGRKRAALSISKRFQRGLGNGRFPNYNCEAPCCRRLPVPKYTYGYILFGLAGVLKKVKYTRSILE